MEFNHHFEQAISTPRLNTYRSQASSDENAWALYRWNIDLAAAVAPLAADLEVTLHNTIHARLTEHFGRPDWWASTSLLLDDITAEMLTEVVRKHQKKITKAPLAQAESSPTPRSGYGFTYWAGAGTAPSDARSTTRPSCGVRRSASASPPEPSRHRAEKGDQPAPTSTIAPLCSSGSATGRPTTNRSSMASRVPGPAPWSPSETCGSSPCNCWGG